MTAKKMERLDLRVDAKVKTRIKQASAFLNEDMTEFVIKRILPDVDRILEAQREIKLRDDSWAHFENMLLTPRRASAKLKDAMKEYAETQKKG